MEQKVNAEQILNSEWLEARKKKAAYNKARRERYKNDPIYRAKQQARCKKYNATHKDTRDRSKYQRDYYMANREKILIAAMDYRLKPGYKEKHSTYMKQYHKEHGW